MKAEVAAGETPTCEDEAEEGPNGKTFGDVRYPPTASKTNKVWYSFKPEHGVGPLIAGGWHHAQALWQSTGNRWPRGYTSLDDAVAGLLADWKDLPADKITISLK